MKKTEKFRRSVAVMLAVLMVITMLPQNSMLTFAAETAAMENPGTISENDGKSGEDAAAGEEEAEIIPSDRSEKAEIIPSDGGGVDDELDKDDASGEGAAEDDGGVEEEPENPEGISENTIEDPGGNEAPEINMVRFPGNKDEYSAVYTGGQIRPVMAVSYQYTNGGGQKVVQKLKLN